MCFTDNLQFAAVNGVAVILQVGTLANKGACPSNQYTHSGECCKQCQPGEGVVQPCGAQQTVCEPCLDSEYHTNSCLNVTRTRTLVDSGVSDANTQKKTPDACTQTLMNELAVLVTCLRAELHEHAV